MVIPNYELTNSYLLLFFKVFFLNTLLASSHKVSLYSKSSIQNYLLNKGGFLPKWNYLVDYKDNFFFSFSTDTNASFLLAFFVVVVKAITESPSVESESCSVMSNCLRPHGLYSPCAIQSMEFSRPAYSSE